MRTVLVTGANSGIGFSIVQLFLENNYKVFAHYHSSCENLEKINNDNVVLLKYNLNNIDETNKLFEKVIGMENRLDILVNNAAIYKPVDSFNELDIDLFDEALNVNLKSPFILSKKYIGHTCNKGGRIINISSIGVKYGGSVNSMFYTVTKASLEAMTISISKEAAKYNILVNALRVGVTNTHIHKNNKNKNMNNRINMIPLKRMAEPIEIAEYVLFLSSEKNNYTTGSIITIAGGE